MMSVDRAKNQVLAVNGGDPAKGRPNPPMYPGGMEIGPEEEEAVLEVLRSKRLFRYYGPNAGPSKVEALEKAFAAHMGTRRALAVTSGTAALICALQGLGVGPGDEVIVPAYTWIASASAVMAVGGIPIMAEVDETLTLDPADVERRITPYTKAIMPVHMRGAPCRMDALTAIARQHGLTIIEDTAQANGASFGGRRLGSIGDVGIFSLQFNKIITAGEGGVVITDDDQIWQRALMFHDVVGGQRNNIAPAEILWGVNFRMAELLAAVALVQLKRLDGLLDAMRQRKRMLKDGIAPVLAAKGFRFREMADPAGDAAIALVFFVDRPETAHWAAGALKAENINASVLYSPDRSDYHIYPHWAPIMNQKAWTPDGGPWRWAQRPIEYTPDMCPRSLDLLGRAIHLDISPLLTNEDVEEMIDGITRVVEAA
ncbi:MAG: DegT/DnrJ/EryC1/StrS family aminotransferase [Caldilineaceae bacterium]|nr:DegT/DnrJ/EryC1/StrS family aminotransferase [Caldilineaceae bacterium]